jgi:hypothetical protein
VGYVGEGVRVDHELRVVRAVDVARPDARLGADAPQLAPVGPFRERRDGEFAAPIPARIRLARRSFVIIPPPMRFPRRLAGSTADRAALRTQCGGTLI